MASGLDLKGKVQRVNKYSKYSDGGGTFGHCSALYAQGCGRFSPSRILRTVLMYGRKKEADEWI